MKLLIVESPKKCGTIKKFLGGDYIVKASVGHVRKIPEKSLNIDLKNDYTPTFEVSNDKKDIVKELKTAAKSVDEIILAMDPDPEGEAIAWHLYDLFDEACKKKCTRITYTSVTPKAVKEALKNKRDIDMNIVNSQKARQVLDRLIGYKISPVLWYKAKINKSSAGRVQSVALKIVAERHKEIEAFKPEDYWFLTANLKNDKGEFEAKVVTKSKDNRYKDEKIAKEDLDNLKKATYEIEKIEKKEKKNKAQPPFDTNSMQGACGNVFGWSLSKSKTLAQSLYEQGFVTYIRTDSFNISEEAMGDVRDLIKKASSEHLPAKPNVFKKKGSSSKEAHECIRPTDIYNKGDGIDDPDAKKMYQLIRDRFIACQMKPQIVDTVTYHTKTDTGHKLISHGQTVKFDGWTKVYKHTKTKEEILPEVSKGEIVDLKDMKKTKHTTKPPARYNEVSLSKKMEEAGVGRPSTRTGIITAIQKKGYVEKENGKKGLIATPFGLQIYEYLEPNFKDFFMDIKYTSALEADLDKIENGEKSFLDVVDATYKTMQKYIGDADGKEKEPPKTTGEKCKKCKEGEIVEKTSRFGPFFSCNKYPECKTIYNKSEDGKFSVKEKPKLKKLGTCEKCKKGNIVERPGKDDKPPWYACDAFPKCRTTFTKNDDGTFEMKVKKNWKKPSS